MAYDYEFTKRSLAKEAKEKRIHGAKRLAAIFVGSIIGIAVGGGFDPKIFADGDVFAMAGAAILGAFGAFFAGAIFNEP